MNYTLLPPTDERVLSSIVPFDKEVFKKQEKISITEFCNNMFETMKNYGGIGLSANQVGKPYRMFVMGDNPNIEKGRKWVCINPEITDMSKQTIRYKEGCLTFPLLFVILTRPAEIKVKYQNADKEVVEEELSGIDARCFLHEYDHLEGKVFLEHASDMKLQRAIKKRDKNIKKLIRQQMA